MCGLHHLASFPTTSRSGGAAYEYWGQATRPRPRRAGSTWRSAPRARPGDLDHRSAQRAKSGVMRRLGMTFDREAQIEDEGIVFDAVVYAITAEEWRLR